MKTLKYLTASVVISSLSLFAASNNAPMSFSSYDMNNDGQITSEEFNTVKANNMAQKAEEGRLMKNAANSPQFEDIDANKDGVISKEELQIFQQNRLQERKTYMNSNGMGSGMGQGQGKGKN